MLGTEKTGSRCWYHGVRAPVLLCPPPLVLRDTAGDGVPRSAGALGFA